MDAEGKYPETCANPAHEPAWEDEDDIYYACPERFIPLSIYQWSEQYFYEKEFGTHIEHENRNTKYIDAVKEYHHWVDYWRDILNPPKGK